jgi:hypothetical protein
MKKMYLFFVLFILTLSVAYAQDSSRNNSDLNIDDSDNNSGSNDLECVDDSGCDLDELCVSNKCEDSDKLVEEIDTETEELDNNINNSDSNSNNTDDESECTLDSDCDLDELCVSNECEDADNETEVETELDDDSKFRNNTYNNRTKWIKECVTDSSLKNVNELVNKIKRAEVSGDTNKILELKQKLKELNSEIKIKVDECNRLRNMNQGYFVSEAVKSKNGSAVEIVEYYKLKLTEISMQTDEAIRLKMLKELRTNIDLEIKNILEHKEIRNNDVKDLVQKIEVRRDKIKADDIEVDSENKTIITEINGKEVEIKILNQQIKIIVDGVEVDTSAITIENNTLFYNGTMIKQLPSEALLRYKFKNMETELEQEGNKIVYKIKYEENRKILGLFKAKAQRIAQINSDDGEELDNKGPWWNFLATDDNSKDNIDNTTITG